MPIYTKKGDQGQTSLPSAGKLSKGQPLFEFLGNLDEANAQLGFTLAQLRTSQTELSQRLKTIQSCLLSIGALIAIPETDARLLSKLEKTTQEMENQIDRWDDQLPKLANFILPGGTPEGASLHLSRTVVRRCERSFNRISLDQNGQLISQFLNRLSDYCFQAARYVNFASDQSEDIWLKDSV